MEQVTKAYSKLCQSSKIDLFGKAVNRFQSLNILENRQGSENTFGLGGRLIWQAKLQQSLPLLKQLFFIDFTIFFSIRKCSNQDLMKH